MYFKFKFCWTNILQMKNLFVIINYASVVEVNINLSLGGF